MSDKQHRQLRFPKSPEGIKQTVCFVGGESPATTRTGEQSRAARYQRETKSPIWDYFGFKPDATDKCEVYFRVSGVSVAGEQRLTTHAAAAASIVHFTAQRHLEEKD